MTIEETFKTSDSDLDWRNTSFSKIEPKLQIAWDSTSFGALDKCPRFYQYSIIEGYVPTGENDHIKFGWLLHATCELYDKEIAETLNHDAALLKAIRFALIETWDFERARPWTSEEPTKNRNTLLRSIIWYLDRFKDDHMKTHILQNGKPAVEYSFRFALGLESFTHEEYQLCGHIDKVVEWNDGGWIRDIKTSKYDLDSNFFRQFLPDNQVSIYQIAGQVTFHMNIDGFIIDGIQVLVNGTRFRRQPIPTSPELQE